MDARRLHQLRFDISDIINNRNSNNGNSRNDGGGGKRNGRNYDHKETVDLRSECISMVIGRGRSNIQRLQTDYNVRVHLDKRSCKITVSGNNEEDVRSALKSIEDQMEKSDNRGGAELSRKKLWAACPPLTKNVYQVAPEVAALSKTEAQRIRAENNNTTVARVIIFKDVTSDEIPNPIWKFEQCFAAYPDLLAEIENNGLQKPSPIQSQAWPILLKGEDMIVIAQTGTDRTLAFLLPALIHTEHQSVQRSDESGPSVLVLAPNREFALQIEKEVNKYYFRGIKAVCACGDGGGNSRDLINSIESGVEIIISTPSSLIDLMQAKIVDISAVTYLVLEKADQMLCVKPQILKILLNIRPDRQTVMTSSSCSVGFNRSVQKYMTNPILVCVGSLDLPDRHPVQQIEVMEEDKYSATVMTSSSCSVGFNRSVQKYMTNPILVSVGSLDLPDRHPVQQIEVMEEEDKYSAIKRFAENMKSDDKIIVFCARQAGSIELSIKLTLEGFKATFTNGTREQCDLEAKILIAADFSTVNRDIVDVTHVINYDFPRSIKEYVYRVRRTRRFGPTAILISYITRSDGALASKLITVLKEAGQHVPDELRNMKKKKSRYGGEESGGPRYRY